MLYFAYGSNMDSGQMRQRCPSAQFVAIAKLPDHRLAFTRHAKDRDCGTCDGVPEPGQDIWGVVFDISESDLRRLDESEGYQPGRPSNANCYVREKRPVYRDGNREEPLLVWLYFANRQPNPPLPNAAYKKQLVDGAKFWRLPEEYQAQLRQIQTA
ncbi:MAG: gamma-glutamylcyclotransferase family protein [Verrucomicrobiota bacterium]|jgi:gamma-glutamylcyclotransferase